MLCVAPRFARGTVRSVEDAMTGVVVDTVVVSKLGSGRKENAMPMIYSNPERAADPHALPDIEVFELNAEEVAEHDEDLIYEYMKKHEFRLAGMNSLVRSRMFDAIVAEHNIEGGWFWQVCFPGCLPDSTLWGPFETYKVAVADARAMAIDDFA